VWTVALGMILTLDNMRLRKVIVVGMVLYV
jgi:hypothetical protein